MQPGSKRAVALVLVLSFVVLVSLLVVGFFGSASSARRDTAGYEAATTARQLSELATNIIIGQIFDATRSWEIPAATPLVKGGGARLTYATQPGMIRTYDSSGKPWRAFKLYSSATMVTEPGVEWNAAAKLADEVPATWAEQPALYTDMNAPVLVADPGGQITFPGSTQTASAAYPILDPGGLSPSGGTAKAQDGVEGFDLRNVPGFGGAESDGRPVISDSYDPTFVKLPGVTANPAPMPVQWIYVLRDGRLTSPTGVGVGGLEVNWNGLPDGDPNKPSDVNPITGRIAFWTDDETSKLNINTASEGTYWDRAWAVGDVAASPYGENQLRDRVPVRGEYQRYPGHPATTCLSPVFGHMADFKVPTGDALTVIDHDTMLAKYYGIVPRVTAGGTRGGTLASYYSGSSAPAITVDTERLYASVDELAFAPGALVNGMRSTTGRLQPSAIERAKFFLTANARCAEVTVFNTPRLLLWQLQQQTDPNGGRDSTPVTPRNAKDQLLAFCGTVNGFPFYFQRYSVYMRAPVNDRLSHPDVPFQQLPQFGYAPPSSQRPALDWQITRNQELYKYLRGLTAQPLPGLGGTITDKYPSAVRDQILTEMVDLIRMGTNAYAADPSVPPRYEYAPARQMPDAVSGETQIVPLVPGPSMPGAGTKGFGRFPTITEAALVFYATGKSATEPDKKMRAALVLEPFSPTAGSWTWSPLVRYVVKGLNSLTINGRTSLFPETLTSLVTSRCGYASGGNHNTAHTGTFAAFRYWNGSGNDGTKLIQPPGTVKFDEEKDYPFVSDSIPIDPAQGQKDIQFSGGEITVEIHAGYATEAAPDTLVQTVRLRFGKGTWPLPRFSGADSDFNNRIGAGKFNIINAADTVRSVEVDPNGPTRGDLRMVSAMPVVPSNFFAGYAGGADGGGYDSSAAIVHSLRNGDGGTLVGGRFHANLFDGTAGTLSASPGNPIAARGTKAALLGSGAAFLPGDWDNGPAGFQDGCYVNKPDDYYGRDDWWASPIVTPNRQVSSPVVFGSLPVGSAMNPVQPWRTLLFCANPAAGASHPGFAKPRDHAFLDFFTMPVVEPYAISEPFSTAGKVNLNYQIAPFTYIRRATALRGVLKSVRITAIPNTAAATYKSGISAVLRKEVDADETLRAFEERFADPAKGGIFRSASEICDMPLVPKGATLANIRANWWASHALTGDNAREIPYGLIYPRVTTKSNTFTVHTRVQVLKKRRASTAADAAVWREDMDTVVAEHRSATTLERYVDTGDTTLPDFATQPDATLDRFYKVRVVGVRRFSPARVVTPLPTPTPKPPPTPTPTPKPPTPTPTPKPPTPTPTPPPTPVPTPKPTPKA